MARLTQFYTYLYLRENGAVKYVGKGTKKRAFESSNHRGLTPKDKNLILLQEHPTEDDAFEAEKFFISYYGRKDLGTGCLRNLTDGGENPPRTKKGRRILWGDKIRKTLEGNSVCRESGRKTVALFRERGEWPWDKTRKGRPAWNKGKPGWKKRKLKTHCKRGHARVPENIRKGACIVCLRQRDAKRGAKIA